MKTQGGKGLMKFSRPFFSTISWIITGAMILTLVAPVSLYAAPLSCDYDSDNPSLDHAVKSFMDPALFDCAELEIRDVLKITEPGRKDQMARIYFLLAGAAFGQKMSRDVPDSLIVDYIVRGFLAEPNWAGKWYFADIPEFMNFVSAAREKSDELIKCPFDINRPSLTHAREMITCYDLFNCGIDEAKAAINLQETSGEMDSTVVAEAYFLIGQAYFGMAMTGEPEATDSVITDKLTTGFMYQPGRQGGWLYGENGDFMSLVEEAQSRAGIMTQKHRSLWKPVLLVAGIGATVTGFVLTIIGGGDHAPTPSIVDTIPSFPDPPEN